MPNVALSVIAKLLREWKVNQWFSEFWNIRTVICDEAIKNRVYGINVETRGHLKYNAKWREDTQNEWKQIAAA